MDTLQATVPQLKDLFTQRRVAIFAGAGLSVDAPSFNPDWNTYRSMILQALLISADSKAVLDQEQVLAFRNLIADFQPGSGRQFKPEVFMELLQSQIGDKALDVLSILDRGSYNTNHLFLARAAKYGHLKVIITTNFDQYIERALIAEGVPHQVYSHPSEFSRGTDMDSGEPLRSVSVVKLHGSLERKDTIRITLRQAARPLERDKTNFLRTIMTRFHVLFYGYSGNDDDIRPVLHTLSDVAAGITWCLWDELSLTKEIEALLGEYGSKANVFIQNRTRIFPELFRELGYGQGNEASLQCHVEGPQRRANEPNDQKILNEWANLIGPADILHVLGAASRSVSNFELAKHAFWKELDIFEASKSWLKYANANLALAETLEMEADYNSAFDCYLENMFIGERLHDLPGLAIANSRMAKVQIYLRAVEKALDLANSAVEAFEHFHQLELLALAVNIRGEIQLYRGELSQAQADWAFALKIAEKDGDLVNVAAASSNLSLAFRLNGEYDRAKELLHTTIKLDSRHGDILGLGLSYGNLAFLEEQYGNLFEAKAALNEATKRLREVRGSAALGMYLNKHETAFRRVEGKLKDQGESNPTESDKSDDEVEEFLFNIRIPTKAIGFMEIMQPTLPERSLAHKPSTMELRLWASTGKIL